MRKVGPFTLSENLGNGLTSSVFVGKISPHSAPVAVKFPSREQIARRASIPSLFANEFRVLSKLNHERIIRTVGYYSKTTFNDQAKGVSYLTPSLVFELAENGDFCELLMRTQALGDEEVRFYFWQLLQAVDFLHCEGFAHRDIKPENLLIDSELNLKLSDFAFACPLDSKDFRKVGTNGYMAPEIKFSISYDFRKADLFAVGLVLYAMSTGSQLFASSGREDQNFRCFFDDPEAFWALKALTDEVKALPSSLVELLRGLIHPEPSQRWGVSEILGNEWYNQSVDENLVKEEMRRRVKTKSEKRPFSERTNLLI